MLNAQLQRYDHVKNVTSIFIQDHFPASNVYAMNNLHYIYYIYHNVPVHKCSQEHQIKINIKLRNFWIISMNNLRGELI